MRDRQPPPPGTKDILQTLRPILGTTDSGMTRDQAVIVLQNDGYAEDEISYYLEFLLNRGYLYEVDQNVFFTDA